MSQFYQDILSPSINLFYKEPNQICSRLSKIYSFICTVVFITTMVIYYSDSQTHQKTSMISIEVKNNEDDHLQVSRKMLDFAIVLELIDKKSGAVQLLDNLSELSIDFKLYYLNPKEPEMIQIPLLECVKISDRGELLFESKLDGALCIDYQGYQKANQLKLQQSPLDTSSLVFSLISKDENNQERKSAVENNEIQITLLYTSRILNNLDKSNPYQKIEKRIECYLSDRDLIYKQRGSQLIFQKVDLTDANKQDFNSYQLIHYREQSSQAVQNDALYQILVTLEQTKMVHKLSKPHLFNFFSEIGGLLALLVFSIVIYSELVRKLFLKIDLIFELNQEDLEQKSPNQQQIDLVKDVEISPLDKIMLKVQTDTKSEKEYQLDYSRISKLLRNQKSKKFLTILEQMQILCFSFTSHARQRRKQFTEHSQFLRNQLNPINIINQLDEIDKFKKLLFSNDQQLLLNYIRNANKIADSDSQHSEPSITKHVNLIQQKKIQGDGAQSMNPTSNQIPNISQENIIVNDSLIFEYIKQIVVKFVTNQASELDVRLLMNLDERNFSILEGVRQMINQLQLVDKILVCDGEVASQKDQPESFIYLNFSEIREEKFDIEQKSNHKKKSEKNRELASKNKSSKSFKKTVEEDARMNNIDLDQSGFSQSSYDSSIVFDQNEEQIMIPLEEYPDLENKIKNLCQYQHN